MARSLFAYLDPTRWPDRAALQAAVRALGFRFVVDEGWVPHGSADYLPCTLEGEDAGVYVRFEREVAWPDGAGGAEMQGSRTERVSLRWGGDPREEMSAMILAAALASSFDALVIEPEGGAPRTADSLTQRARTLHAENF